MNGKYFLKQIGLQTCFYFYISIWEHPCAGNVSIIFISHEIHDKCKQISMSAYGTEGFPG